MASQSQSPADDKSHDVKLAPGTRPSSPPGESATAAESHHDGSNGPEHGSPERETSQTPKQLPPTQKRRRVTRACDECRRKKIKCDGQQPCTHCSVYSYDCTYDQPSNRRRNPAPQYVEALEARARRAEAVLRVLAPDISLDDPRLDTVTPEQLYAMLRRDGASAASAPRPGSEGDRQDESTDPPDESLLETMMENSGSLIMDDQGHWDYLGHSSGIVFMQRLKKQFGNIVPPMRNVYRQRPILKMVEESPRAQSESPQDSTLPATHDLPPREVAKQLARNTFDHACCLMRFVHEPSFFSMLDRIYDTPWEQFSNVEHSFLPLLYIVIAVGCLFSYDMGSSANDDYEGAIGRGFQYFRTGRNLLDITDCRDLTSLQAICFMIIFLQSSARLSTCYSYVGIAQRAALRLGLHRSVEANFNPIERELRKRIFWVIRRMDIYVSTLLGLPQMVSMEDIDQEYPLEVDDKFITPTGILPMPEGRISLMAGANAHARLVEIIVKVVKYIYPVRNAKHRNKSDHTYVVRHSKIREIEQDLQAWLDGLPPALRPGGEVPIDFERMRQMLRISYAHVQIALYRPFLHYVSKSSQARGIDKRSYACAAACVSVSRNIVHITAGMYKKGLLNGSYWFTMYTTYFAILTLVFFVMENPDLPASRDSILKDALEGKNTLAGLAKKSLAADRCASSLNCLFSKLPEWLKNQQSSAAPPANLKRPSPANTLATRPKVQREIAMSEASPLQRSNSFPTRPKTDPPPVRASVDDSAAFRQPQSWLSNEVANLSAEPESLSESPSQQEQSASSIPPTMAPAQPSSTKQNLPDLMPIMFPSGDPFAYPTQPMSTLEDGHFKDDTSRTAQFFGDGHPSSAAASTSTAIASGGALAAGTPGFDGSPGLTPGSSSGGMSGPQLAGTFQRLGLQSQAQSPSSRSGGSSDHAQSPDLVSLPQSSMWQSFHFPSQGFFSGQQSSMAGDAPRDMAVDPMSGFGPMGLEMDMNFNLDDVLFGSIGGGASGSFLGDDWSQLANFAEP